jgi:hypothetical protein
MDLAAEELEFLTTPDLLKESISIPKRCPQTFYLITLTLIFPLSFAILAHSLFTHPLLLQVANPIGSHSSQWSKLLLFQFCYLIFLFAFSLLSTAAVVFTVASIYTSKPVSFSSTVAAIPTVFKRLFITFIWVSFSMAVYNLVFVGFLLVLLIAIDENNVALSIFAILVIFILFLGVHVYISALWHLASVVSVLEPIYGMAAMKKSFELLNGKAKMGGILVFFYLGICGAINGLFASIVVHGGDYSVFTRIIVGGFLVGVLVIVNLVGLLVQSVFYYFCKSYHHEGIDKSALYDHLGGYLGEYVPLKSSVQMENLDT